MTIAQEMSDELKDAMKSGDHGRRDVIRQVQTEVSTAKSEPGFDGVVDDAFYRRVIGSYVKKMDKAAGEYEDLGERGQVMAAKLRFEVRYLGRWLPAKLDEARTRELAKAMIAELDVAGDPKSAGRVIGGLMKARGADLDGALVSRIVSEELSAG